LDHFLMGGEMSDETAEPSGYVTRWFQRADKQEILQLNALEGGVSELAESDYFDWLYNENPAGRPLLAVATETTTGQIIGFIWYIPIRLRYFGTTVCAYLGANALVHPDYRRRHVYSALQAMAVKECIQRGAAVLYGFGRPASIKGAKAFGFEAINIPLLAKPFDMKQLAHARGLGPVLAVALTVGWRLAEATVLHPKLPRGNIKVQQEAAFDESFDRFWQRVADKYPIVVVRDRTFLTWRFCSVPFREYEILSVRDGSELIGYALLRCGEILDVRCGLIMDLLVEPGARGNEAGLYLLAAATQRFREAGTWMTVSLMLSHTQEYALLRQAGYALCPQRVASRSYALAARRCAPEILGDSVVHQSRHWFVTLANHDAC
jgi:GNAT superfamily N-acetyltransferase